MSVRRKRGWRRIVAAGSCLLVSSWVVWAADGVAERTGSEPAPPSGPQDPLVGAEMMRIQNMIANAQGKLRNNVMGFHEDSGDAQKKKTLTEQCCSMNIERIREAVERLDRRLHEMAACHEERGSTDQALATQIALNDLEQIGRGVELFAKADTPQRAWGVAGALTRAFNLLRQSMATVEDCGESRLDEQPHDGAGTSEAP